MSKILVVDDEVDIAETLQLFLELNGYKAVVAFDGREGLNLALAEQPDLIVTDMMMPKMDGAELIEKVRATPTIASVPIITMLANPQPRQLPFFRKPFDPAALVAEIGRILDS